jgi:glycine cleavage system H protein
MTIESVKMAADIYSPVTGKVVNVNESLSGNPGTVNESADKTWLFEVEYNSEPSGLLNR